MALPTIDITVPVKEAGRAISTERATMFKRALQAIKQALESAGISLDDEDSDSKDATNSKDKDAKEASGGFSNSDLADLLNTALRATQQDTDDYFLPMIHDIFEDYFVYRNNWSGPYYKVDYTVNENGIVTLGTPLLVVRKVDYIEPLDTIETSEADYTCKGDYIPLLEAAVNPSGLTRIKLIAPGWGSSGYYSSDVLRRDGPSIFKSGTKMFWDHPTAAEEHARPEGSLDNLAAVLTELIPG